MQPSDEIKARHRRTVTVSTLLSTIVSAITIAGLIGAPVWTIWLRPALAQSVAEELADTIDAKIDATVQDRLEPVNSGLKAIILGMIMSLEEEVSQLEYVRDFRPVEWTDVRRQELLRKEATLRTYREAMGDILEAENR